MKNLNNINKIYILHNNDNENYLIIENNSVKAITLDINNGTELGSKKLNNKDFSQLIIYQKDLTLETIDDTEFQKIEMTISNFNFGKMKKITYLKKYNAYNKINNYHIGKGNYLLFEDIYNNSFILILQTVFSSLINEPREKILYNAKNILLKGNNSTTIFSANEKLNKNNILKLIIYDKSLIVPKKNK